MNLNELHADLAESGQTNRQRLLVKFAGLFFIAWLSVTVTVFLGSYLRLQVHQGKAAAAVPATEALATSWIIEGALTEACTEFAANYIFGWDKKNPLIVRNNTTWRILDAIKAKTTVYRVKVGEDSIDTKDTNSNQGNFTYTDKTNFGGPEFSSCSSTMNSKAELPADENWCGK